MSSANHIPNRILGTGNRVVNNRVKLLAFMELFLWWRIDLTWICFGAIPKNAILDGNICYSLHSLLPSGSGLLAGIIFKNNCYWFHKSFNIIDVYYNCSSLNKPQITVLFFWITKEELPMHMTKSSISGLLPW